MFFSISKSTFYLFQLTQSKSRRNNKKLHGMFNCIPVNFEKTQHD